MQFILVVGKDIAIKRKRLLKLKGVQYIDLYKESRKMYKIRQT